MIRLGTFGNEKFFARFVFIKGKEQVYEIFIDIQTDATLIKDAKNHVLHKTSKATN